MNLLIMLAIVATILLIEYLRDCDHDWRIIKTSDILEFDEAGYPMVLCLLQCQRCNLVKLEFVRVPPEFVPVYRESKRMHNIAWSVADSGFGAGGLHV